MKSLRSDPSEALFIAISILTNGTKLICNGDVILDQLVSPEEGLTGFSELWTDLEGRIFPGSGVRDLL